ncbi:MAG: type II toxin-antitoxin system RelE/ParE family toxin [Acidobacteria bacterium]|nr:type II toxin-antitoxin system RelE/ParE family toxin [Acidobacteriota bacterium]MBV9477236.1 type II toxin-antitoxin system RelE/ParE family toxin [Acidobacteriota bacterium]
MWNDRLRITETAERDFHALTGDERAAVRDALQRIDDDPIAGAPLFDPLKGLWSYRVGALRIIYRIVAEARFIVVLTIARVRQSAR